MDGMAVLSGFGAGALDGRASAGRAVLAAPLAYPSLPAHRLAGTGIAQAVAAVRAAGGGRPAPGPVDAARTAATLIGFLPASGPGARLITSMPERRVRTQRPAACGTAGFQVIH